MMDKFQDSMCIKFAIVNSWAIVGGPLEDSENNQVIVHGDPNIWVVTNC